MRLPYKPQRSQRVLDYSCLRYVYHLWQNVHMLFAMQAFLVWFRYALSAFLAEYDPSLGSL